MSFLTFAQDVGIDLFFFWVSGSAGLGANGRCRGGGSSKQVKARILKRCLDISGRALLRSLYLESGGKSKPQKTHMQCRQKLLRCRSLLPLLATTFRAWLKSLARGLLIRKIAGQMNGVLRRETGVFQQALQVVVEAARVPISRLQPVFLMLLARCRFCNAIALLGNCDLATAGKTG